MTFRQPGKIPDHLRERETNAVELGWWPEPTPIEMARHLAEHPDFEAAPEELPTTLAEWEKIALKGSTIEAQSYLRAVDNRVRAQSKKIEAGWDAAERAAEYEPAAVDLDDFLGEEEPPTDWVIPGLLGREDRIIVTGLEGSGKSMLSRQIAVCAASGVHPFDLLAVVEPQRVLYVDLENPKSLTRSVLRKLKATAGNRYRQGGLTVVARPEGMDLVGNDGAELREEIELAGDIDLLVIGPLYKMVSVGDVTEEPVARELTATLDRLRIEYGFALWIEAHAPHQSGHDNNPDKMITRPYGASLFKRWPEFGYFLHWNPDTGVGQMRRWRSDRWADRGWPDLVRRGGAWPWTVPESEADVAWRPIKEAAERHAAENKGNVPSIRRLAEDVGMTRSTMDRFLKAEAWRWDELKRSLLAEYGPAPKVLEGQETLSHEDR